MPPKSALNLSKKSINKDNLDDIVIPKKFNISIDIKIRKNLIDNKVNSNFYVRVISRWTDCCYSSEILGSDLFPWKESSNDTYYSIQSTYECDPDLNTIDKIKAFNKDPGIYVYVIEQDTSIDKLKPIAFVYIDCSILILEVNTLTSYNTIDSEIDKIDDIIDNKIDNKVDIKKDKNIKSKTSKSEKNKEDNKIDSKVNDKIENKIDSKVNDKIDNKANDEIDSMINNKIDIYLKLSVKNTEPLISLNNLILLQPFVFDFSSLINFPVIPMKSLDSLYITTLIPLGDGTNRLLYLIPKSINTLTDLPTNRSIDLPTNRSNDLPTNRSNDLPTNRSNELATNRSNELATNRSNDLPSNRSNGLSTDRSMDLPTNRSMDLPTNRSVDLPTNRSNDIPSDRLNDLPTNRSVDLPTNRSNNLTIKSINVSNYQLNGRICILPGLMKLKSFEDILLTDTIIVKLFEGTVNDRLFTSMLSDKFSNIINKPVVESIPTSPTNSKSKSNSKIDKKVVKSTKSNVNVLQPSKLIGTLPTEGDEFLITSTKNTIQEASNIFIYGEGRLRLETILNSSNDEIARYKLKRNNDINIDTDNLNDKTIVIKEKFKILFHFKRPSEPEKWLLPASLSLRQAVLQSKSSNIVTSSKHLFEYLLEYQTLINLKIEWNKLISIYLLKFLTLNQSNNLLTDKSINLSSNPSFNLIKNPSTNQSTSQSTNPSTSQSTNQPSNQSSKQSTNPSTNLPINQITTQSSKQSITPNTNLPINQSNLSKNSSNTNLLTNRSNDEIIDKALILNNEIINHINNNLFNDIVLYARLVFILPYDDTQIIPSLLSNIKSINHSVLPNIQGSISTYVLNDKEQQLMLDGELDLISGFMLVDKNIRILIIEGLSHGTSLETLYSTIPSLPDMKYPFKILKNPSILYPKRLYPTYLPNLKYLKLRNNFSNIMKKYNSYDSKQIDLLCYTGLNKLNDLIYCESVIESKTLDMYPSELSMNQIELLYGDALNYDDMNGISISDQMKQSNQSVDKESLPIYLSTTELKRSLVHQSRLGNTICRNKEFEDVLEMRSKIPPKDYLQEQREIRRKAWKEYMIKAKEKYQQDLKFFQDIGLINDNNSLPKVYTYSTQYHNIKEKALKAMKKSLIKEKNCTFTYSKDFMTQSVSFEDIIQDSTTHLLTSKAKEPFQYPKPKSIAERNALPNRPTDVRIEDLKDPWPNDLIDLKSDNNMKDKKTLERENNFKLRIPIDETFGMLKQPIFEENELQVKYIGDPEHLPRGKMLSKSYEKDPNYNTSIHIGGDAKAQLLEEIAKKELLDWKSKVVVDDPNFYITNYVVKDKPTSILDKRTDILHDKPKTKSLNYLYNKLNYEPTPLTTMNQGEFIDNVNTNILLRKDDKDKFITTKLESLNYQPIDFTRYINPNESIPRVSKLQSKRKHPPLNSNECIGAKWEGVN